ncbi:MAG TPA: ATP-binding cassette domain-containing protein [Steroidobacteraceae bacterium]|nr:ATP-binding cassette domain-containing protein [Steroidobacteraceae bacterium]
MMEPLLEVRGIVNRFGAQTVHRGLDMQVQSGEIFGIVGGSGSGKSVLLRTIIGLRRPQAGSVCFMGQDLSRMRPPELRRLRTWYGVTFQEGALFSALTVRENIQLPMREHLQLADRGLEELTALKICLVGLTADTAGKYPAELSGGMIKRAALARALALDPALLLLDEPTSGLDPIGAAAFDDLLLYLHQQLHLTVVMITHDLDSILRTCSRVGVIVDGRMISDTLQGITHNPHPWIRAYFGGKRAQARRGIDGA